MLGKSSAEIVGRFGENKDHDEADAGKKSIIKWKCAVFSVCLNMRSNDAKSVKRDDDDGNALIRYIGSMSNAMDKLVKTKISELEEVSEIRAAKSELK